MGSTGRHWYRVVCFASRLAPYFPFEGPAAVGGERPCLKPAGCRISANPAEETRLASTAAGFAPIRRKEWCLVPSMIVLERHRLATGCGPAMWLGALTCCLGTLSECHHFDVTSLRWPLRVDMVLPVQCRMARAGLALSIRKLAIAAKVSPQTVVRFERGEAIRKRTIDSLRQVLEAAGVEFTNGRKPGVRMSIR